MIDYTTRNWLVLVLSLRGTVIKRVAFRTVLCGMLAAMAVYLKNERGIDLSVPVVVHSIIGVALGLLLVFRTNTSYDRYWEGRKTVGDMVSHCRDLAHQTSAYLADDSDRLKLAGGYIVAFCASVRRQLRREHQDPGLVTPLEKNSVAELDGSEEPPLTVFGIDEIGVEIEDPFGYDENDLPLDETGWQLEADVSFVTAPPQPRNADPT